MSPQEARARILAGAVLAGGSASVPITNGMMAAGFLAQQPLGGMQEAPSASGAGPQGGGSRYAPSGAGGYNTPLHVGGLLLAFGGVIVLLHLGGFRLAFDVGLGRK